LLSFFVAQAKWFRDCFVPGDLASERRERSVFKVANTTFLRDVAAVAVSCVSADLHDASAPHD
jgi:hypothetical protein